MCVLLFFTLDAELLARSQYSEGPATTMHGPLNVKLKWKAALSHYVLIHLY